MDNMNPMEYEKLYSPSMKDAWITGTLANNMNKDFVRRIASQNSNVSNNILNKNGSRSNLLMADDGTHVFPTIENRGGALRPLGRREMPQENINFKTPEQAATFGWNGYKRANPLGFQVGAQTPSDYLLPQ